MPQMIFVNLPVTDLEKSIAFYQAVGAVKDERFCDGSAAMMTFSDTISVMLLTHERFSQFTDRTVRCHFGARCFWADDMSFRRTTLTMVSSSMLADRSTRISVRFPPSFNPVRYCR